MYTNRMINSVFGLEKRTRGASTTTARAGSRRSCAYILVFLVLIVGALISMYPLIWAETHIEKRKAPDISERWQERPQEKKGVGDVGGDQRGIRAETCMQRAPLHVYMKPTLKLDQLMGAAFGWKLRMVHRICRPIVLHFENFEKAGNDSLLISRFAVPPRPPKAKRNVGLLHLADEPGRASLAAYRREGYDYVVRTYYHPKYLSGFQESWLMWLPVGPKYGVEPATDSSLVRFADRTLACSFLGTIPKGANDLGRRAKSRQEMRAALQRAGDPCYLETTNGGFGGKRHALAYAAVLRNSQFSLCPWGNHPETIRLWDSFETGSIPVMLAATHRFLPPILVAEQQREQPIVLLKSWGELPALLEDARADPETYASRQMQNIGWWERFKRRLATQLDELVSRAFIAAASPANNTTTAI